MKTIRIACETKDQLPLDQLVPFQGGLKALNKANFAKLKGEILSTGFAFPVYVWKGVKGAKYIIGGHQRVSCLNQLQAEGFKIPEIPVVYIHASNVAEAKRRVLQDISQYGDIDKKGLYEFMVDAEISMDLLSASFQIPDQELNMKNFREEFFSSESDEVRNKENEIPSVPKTAKAKFGDIYKLGRHKLMCGDSTNIDSIKKLMDGKKAEICFTSPPYNGDTHLDYGKNNNKKLYENEFDAKSSQDYIDFCHKVLKNIFIVTKNFTFWNVNYNAKSRFEFLKAIYPFADSLWETIAWKKTGMPIPSGLTRNFEFIFVFKGNDSSLKHLGKTNETNFNVWEISNINSQIKDEHRACFPVQLPEKGILLSTEIGDSVFDPFGGSGTTMIAAEKTGRSSFLVELDPHYCDVIVSRWENFTGKKAKLI